MMFGDGRKLMDEVYDSFNVVALPCGQTGGQMFGWFRKELKTPADFVGLKMRTAGFGGKVMAKLGAVPQQIAGGDIYPALERGTIDACEWVGPYDDEKLGFNKVAKYYYTPGVMELEAINQLMIGKAAWASLPPRYQAVLQVRLQLRHDGDAGVLRRQERRGDRPPGRRRHAAVGAAGRDHQGAARGARSRCSTRRRRRTSSSRRSWRTGASSAPSQHRWFSIADTRAENAVYRSDRT